MNKNLGAEKNTELHNVQNVCRLCSATVQLVSVFSKLDAPKPLVEIVTALTTIKISEEDNVSQKICNRCIFNLNKMYEFREKSIRNDTLLKDKYAEIVKGKSTGATRLSKKGSKLENKHGEIQKVCSNVKAKPKEGKLKNIVHPSITPLFKKYPTIRLPAVCITSNISPTVVMELDEVENYFRKRNLCMQKHIDLALKSCNTRRVAMKSSSGLSPSKFAKKTTIPEYFLSLRNRSKKNINVDNGSNRLEVSTLTNISESPVNQRKRKRTQSTDSSLCQSVTSVIEIDTSGNSSCSSPSPVPSLINDASSLTQSRDIHMCNICNAVFLQAIGLKKHHLKHLRCQFCKVKFTSFKTKETHRKNHCKIQKLMKSMTNLPTIPLQKIEQNEKFRKKFEDAFAAFNLIPKEKYTLKTKITQSESSNTKISDGNTTVSKSSQHKIKIAINIRDSQLYPIPDENISEAKLLKALIMQYRKTNRKASNMTQTILPTTQFVKMNRVDSTFELQYLGHHLQYHKIPVEINRASQLNISYKYFYSLKNNNELQTKTLHNWDDLNCCDVSFTSTRVNGNLTVIPQMKKEVVEGDAEPSKQNELVEQMHSPSSLYLSEMPSDEISKENISHTHCDSSNISAESDVDEDIENTISEVNNVLSILDNTEISDEIQKCNSASDFNGGVTNNEEENININSMECESTEENTETPDNEHNEAHKENDKLEDGCLTNEDKKFTSNSTDKEGNVILSNTENKENDLNEVDNSIANGKLNCSHAERNDNGFSESESNGNANLTSSPANHSGNRLSASEEIDNIDLFEVKQKTTNVIDTSNLESENTEVGGENVMNEHIRSPNETSEMELNDDCLSILSSNSSDKHVEEKADQENQMIVADCNIATDNIHNSSCEIGQNNVKDSESTEDMEFVGTDVGLRQESKTSDTEIEHITDKSDDV